MKMPTVEGRPVWEHKVYRSWLKQRERCLDPNHNRYRYYGAKGIRVLYSSYEFVKWYTEEIKKKPGIKFPCCGRIDHSKDYSLDNIEIIERSENAKEMWARNGAEKIGARIRLARRRQLRELRRQLILRA